MVKSKPNVLSSLPKVHVSLLHNRADEQREKIIPGCGNGQRRCGIWNISDPGPATVYPAVRLWHQSEDFIKVHVHRARQWANSNTSRKSYCGGTHRRAWWTRYRETETSWWHGHCCFTWAHRWELHNLFACMHVFCQWKHVSDVSVQQL